MKKPYIIPTTLMEAVQQQTVIAASPSVTVSTNSENGVAPALFEVKEDCSNRYDYNVWEEDWDK